jgi:hypothetical protein
MAQPMKAAWRLKKRESEKAYRRRKRRKSSEMAEKKMARQKLKMKKHLERRNG